ERHRAEQVAEVVPTARVRIRVDTVIREQARDEAEQNQEAVQQPGEKARRARNLGWRLSGAGREQQRRTAERREGQQTSMSPRAPNGLRHRFTRRRSSNEYPSASRTGANGRASVDRVGSVA